MKTVNTDKYTCTHLCEQGIAAAAVQQQQHQQQQRGTGNVVVAMWQLRRDRSFCMLSQLENIRMGFLLLFQGLPRFK